MGKDTITPYGNEPRIVSRKDFPYPYIKNKNAYIMKGFRLNFNTRSKIIKTFI